jgi:hypothetical protein
VAILLQELKKNQKISDTKLIFCRRKKIDDFTQLLLTVKKRRNQTGNESARTTQALTLLEAK